VTAHTGAGFTITIQDTTGATLVTWPALVANGGMFVYGAGPSGDFGAVIPGNTGDSTPPGNFWINGGNPTGPLTGGTEDGSGVSIVDTGAVGIISGSLGVTIDSDGGGIVIGNSQAEDVTIGGGQTT